MPTDEYEVFKSYADTRYLTIGKFARLAMKSEIRRRIRDKYWNACAGKNIIELAQEITRETSEKQDQVYFMRDGDFIKIGFSTDASKRLEILKTDNPHDVELLACFNGNRETERKIHSLFRHCHHRNEWFHVHDDIYGFINAMREATGSILSD